MDVRRCPVSSVEFRGPWKHETPWPVDVPLEDGEALVYSAGRRKVLVSGDYTAPVRSIESGYALVAAREGLIERRTEVVWRRSGPDSDVVSSPVTYTDLASRDQAFFDEIGADRARFLLDALHAERGGAE